MDLDGDGRRDVITGCWPGELYFFRGTEKGLAKASKLTFADGKEVNLGSASTVHAHDWEGDGDLDLLVGDIDGNVFLVPNASGGKGLAFEPAVSVRCGGNSLEVAGDSAPIVADWDGDGRHDLIVGAGDGAVTWYRNLAREGAPLLAPAVTLVPATRNHGQMARGEKTPRCGGRTKPAVADWDQDGDLDLLVGDFSSGGGDAPELTPEQEKQRDALQAEQQKLGQDFSERFQKAMREAAKEQGLEMPEGDNVVPPGDRAQQQKIQERAVELLQADGEAFTKYQERMQALWKELQPLMPANELHGYVWFFAREGRGGKGGDGAPAPVGPAVPKAPANAAGSEQAASGVPQARPAGPGEGASPEAVPSSKGGAPPPVPPASPKPACR